MVGRFIPLFFVSLVALAPSASATLVSAPSGFPLEEIVNQLLPIDFQATVEENLQEFIANFEFTEYEESIGDVAEKVFRRADAVSEGPLVTVEGLGSARGKVLESIFNKEFFAFQSIPFALPPDGEWRFKMPREWNGTWEQNAEGEFDATYIRAKCPQGSLVAPIPGGREDCLHLSIYTPNTILTTPDKKYPVMFFIHGGEFLSGDASFYIPTRLIEEDVVVVVVQYRLGTLGFLAALTPDNPGNMGLMDQVMALRWVQKYIENFGGDPTSVTVFGQSAGAASTSWLQLTPTTNALNNEGQRLLHKAIIQSGSALEVWAHDPDPQGSFILEAEAVGCYDVSEGDPVVDDILTCMRDLPVQDIVKGCLSVYREDRKHGGLGFKGVSPVIQEALATNFPEETQDDPDLLVIPHHPLKIIANDEFLKIPIMIGSVRDEGSLVLGLAYNDFLVANDLTENTTFFRNLLVPSLVYAFGIEDLTGSVANSFRMTYLKNAEMGNWDSMSGGLVDMTGMLFLKSGLWTLSHLLQARNELDDSDIPIYFYSFEFESDDSIFPWFFPAGVPIEGGVTHADDLIYLFYLPSVLDESQTTNVKRMTRLWSNFAKCGNPTPIETSACGSPWEEAAEEWLPFTIQDLNYMLMSDLFTVMKDFTLRWNYNTIKPALEAAADDPTLNMRASEAAAMEEDLQAAYKETEGWQVATFAMAGACLVLLAALVFALLRMGA